MNASPRGNTWVILAQQTIAASLNAANGASAGRTIDAAIAAGQDLLLDRCGSIRPRHTLEAVIVSALLAAYNYGLIGPGHCD